MRKIVVPTDFSIKSYNALTLAKRIAKKTKGTVHLIHVAESILGNYPDMDGMLEDDFDDLYTMTMIEKLWDKLLALKNSESNPSVVIKPTIKVGDPYKEIKKLVKELDAELVIIGAKGFTDPEEFFLGSITDKVVRSMPCPVITVKEVVDKTTFKNIIYATNMEESHAPLMNLLTKLQNLFKSTIHIVKINTRKNFKNDIDTRVALEKLVDQYDLKNYTLNVYNHEDEEYGIVYFADEKRADLIAMGVHEKSGFRRLISGGSLANQVTDHTFRPVLTYRFQAKQKEAGQ